MAKGGGPQTSTVHQSSLPEYAEPFYTDLMERGSHESYRPYQPYGGPRLTGISPDTEYGLGMTSQYANSGYGYLPYGADLGMETGERALEYGSYDPQQFYAATVGEGGGPFGWSGVQHQNFDSSVADRYMSPYMEDVIDLAMKDVAQNTLEEQLYRDSEAANAGAFGGSRAAVQKQMALGQAQDRMMELNVQGRQAAFENAQNQFNQDRGAWMNAQRANQEAQLRSALANQGIGLEAQQLGEQSRQFGANLGMEGLNVAQRSAGLMADMQGQLEKMQLDRIKAQLGIGQTREDYLQEQLDMAYNDFVNQRDHERMNLQFLSSLLQGVPISANQDITTSSSGGGNPLAGGIGTLGGLASIFGI